MLRFPVFKNTLLQQRRRWPITDRSDTVWAKCGWRGWGWGKNNGKTWWFKVPSKCAGKDLKAAIGGGGLEWREKVLNINVEEWSQLKA